MRLSGAWDCLPSKEVFSFKLDLHYSHKIDAVLKLLKENNIRVLYVPARCTDEFQECHTVINKPFKAGMKAAFRDYIHEEFNKYKGDPATWSIKITMGSLKEHIVRFVQTGMSTVRAEEFSVVIRNAFKKHGQFEDMWSAERQLIAATDNLSFLPVLALSRALL
jgi:DDE superfamily endonuclease